MAEAPLIVGEIVAEEPLRGLYRDMTVDKFIIDLFPFTALTPRGVCGIGLEEIQQRGELPPRCRTELQRIVQEHQLMVELIHGHHRAGNKRRLRVDVRPPFSESRKKSGHLSGEFLFLAHTFRRQCSPVSLRMGPYSLDILIEGLGFPGHLPGFSPLVKKLLQLVDFLWAG